MSIGTWRDLCTDLHLEPVSVSRHGVVAWRYLEDWILTVELRATGSRVELDLRTIVQAPVMTFWIRERGPLNQLLKTFGVGGAEVALGDRHFSGRFNLDVSDERLVPIFFPPDVAYHLGHSAWRLDFRVGDPLLGPDGKKSPLQGLLLAGELSIPAGADAPNETLIQLEPLLDIYQDIAGKLGWPGPVDRPPEHERLLRVLRDTWRDTLRNGEQIFWNGPRIRRRAAEQLLSQGDTDMWRRLADDALSDSDPIVVAHGARALLRVLDDLPERDAVSGAVPLLALPVTERASVRNELIAFLAERGHTELATGFYEAIYGGTREESLFHGSPHRRRLAEAFRDVLFHVTYVWDAGEVTPERLRAGLAAVWALGLLSESDQLEHVQAFRATFDGQFNDDELAELDSALDHLRRLRQLPRAAEADGPNELLPRPVAHGVAVRDQLPRSPGEEDA